MTLEEFCMSIGRLKLSMAQKAIAILWFFDQQESGVKKTYLELSKIIRANHIGSPNPPDLRKRIPTTGCAYRRAGYFWIREDKKDEIRSWIQDALVGMPQAVPIEEQYLPEQVYKCKRGYILQVGNQINGSYRYGYYDCAAVMIRRFTETLIIESFEKLNRESEIKGGGGDYLMLSDLIDKSVAAGGLNLGRDSKKVLKEIKQKGDYSAHNRRYIAKKTDLDSIKDGLRLCIEELMHITYLYK